ncbi:hypothetical protein [Streptomyces nanshensis]|uniref:Uncharacterized protein n=1 Tax=Streptomyces nanshensis TaxID=518642 RepID=A0A1E7L7G9_9ACTN|nr:hypothetical protein [Streptomyces nanshensis]OEV12119.1 hypothetical protein AN218_09870 [Streptomyces nanshensis]
MRFLKDKSHRRELHHHGDGARITITVEDIRENVVLAQSNPAGAMPEESSLTGVLGRLAEIVEHRVSQPDGELAFFTREETVELVGRTENWVTEAIQNCGIRSARIGESPRFVTTISGRSLAAILTALWTIAHSPHASNAELVDWALAVTLYEQTGSTVERLRHGPQGHDTPVVITIDRYPATTPVDQGNV